MQSVSLKINGTLGIMKSGLDDANILSKKFRKFLNEKETKHKNDLTDLEKSESLGTHTEFVKKAEKELFDLQKLSEAIADRINPILEHCKQALPKAIEGVRGMSKELIRKRRIFWTNWRK